MQQIEKEGPQAGILFPVRVAQRAGGLHLVHAFLLPPLHIHGAGRHAGLGGVAVGEGDRHRFPRQQRSFIRIKHSVGFRDGGNALLQVVRNVQEILLVRLIPGLCVPGLKDFA